MSKTPFGTGTHGVAPPEIIALGMGCRSRGGDAVDVAIDGSGNLETQWVIPGNNAGR